MTRRKRGPFLSHAFCGAGQSCNSVRTGPPEAPLPTPTRGLESPFSWDFRARFLLSVGPITCTLHRFLPGGFHRILHSLWQFRAKAPFYALECKLISKTHQCGHPHQQPSPRDPSLRAGKEQVETSPFQQPSQGLPDWKAAVRQGAQPSAACSQPGPNMCTLMEILHQPTRLLGNGDI